MSVSVGSRRRLFKVSFAPILSEEKDAHGNNMRVGRWMVYVTALRALDVPDVVRHFLPDIWSQVGKCEIDEQIDVEINHSAWSVSVGLPPTTVSLLIMCEHPDDAYEALVRATLSDERMSMYVAQRSFTTRRIDLYRDGVW